MLCGGRLVLLALLLQCISCAVPYDGDILSEAISATLLSHLGKSTLEVGTSHSSYSNSQSFTSESYMEALCSNLPREFDRHRIGCCPKVNGGVIYLHNVQFMNGKVVFYTGSGGERKRNLDGTARIPEFRKLPAIKSVIRRKVTEFSLPVEVRNQNFSLTSCSSFFNGTLYVTGRQTTQNLFHTLNDNILPLFTLIAFDMILQPDFLHAPRALLTGIHPPKDAEQVPHLEEILAATIPHLFAIGKSTEGVCFRRIAWGGGVKVMYQHLLGLVRRLSADLLREVVVRSFNPPNPYEIHNDQTQFVGARRLNLRGGGNKQVGLVGIGRGTGLPRNIHQFQSKGGHDAKRKDVGRKGQSKNTDSGYLYLRANQTIREKLRFGRNSGEFMNAITGTLLNTVRTTTHATPIRTSHALTVATVSNQVNNRSNDNMYSNSKNRALNVVIYTRGSAGFGRVLPGEDALREHLNSLGASTHICCNFRNVTLLQQLGYAVHADVVLGLHGAGLVNTILAPEGVITVELKTIYGYGLTLFALASDARRGTFIELDVRDHHIWGKPGQSRNRPVDQVLIDRVVFALAQALNQRNKLTGASSREIERSINFRQKLFVPLPRSTGDSHSDNLAFSSGTSLHPPHKSNALGGGDLMMLPYPVSSTLYSKYILSLNGNSESSTNRTVEERGGLDFLFHILGPTIQEAPQQCMSMTISRYWEFVSEKEAMNKYCTTCQM